MAADDGHRETCEPAGGDDPFTVWQRLRERDGPTITLIRLYALVAEPIVDIQVSVADLGDEDCYVPTCEAAGLQLRFRDDRRHRLECCDRLVRRQAVSRAPAMRWVCPESDSGRQGRR